MDKAANEEDKVSYLQVLSIPSFRFLWFGQVFSQLSINTVLFVLGLRLYATTGTNAAVSALFLAYGIPAILFGLVAGTAVDHLDKRRVLMFCDAIRAALVLLLFFTSGNIYVVYLVTFINSLISQFYVPAEAPTIPRLVPDRYLVPANSLFSFTYYSSLAIGSIIAGPLLRLLGPHWIFVVLSVLLATASFFDSRLPSMAKGVLGFRTVLQYTVHHVISRITHKLLEGLSYIRKSKTLSDSLLLLTATQIIFVMLGTLGPGFADRILFIDIRDVSLLIVGPAVLGILLGSVWVGNFGARINRRRLIQVGVTGAGATLVVLSLVVRLGRVPLLMGIFTQPVRLVISVILFFLLGFANSLLDVPANSLLQQEAKGSMRGRVYGMLTTAVGGVGIVPVFATGLLADLIGVGKVVFLLGCAVLLYGIVRIRYNHT